MKVLVIGGSGIIGQTMMTTVPDGMEVIFTRLHGDGVYQSLDITRPDLGDSMTALDPDVIVNLAGINSPDEVERDVEAARAVNVDAALRMFDWAGNHGKFMVHASSQAALDHRANTYAAQKFEVERAVAEGISRGHRGCIIRPSFVLGIRPFPGIGRDNPAERMLDGRESKSVDDRKFTACFVWDVARLIWSAVISRPSGAVWQCGGVDGVSRWDVARALGCNSEPVSHDLLTGLAQRPMDTTYKTFEGTRTDAAEGFRMLREQYAARKSDNLEYRALELAAFFKLPGDAVRAKLGQGFGALHVAVNENFRRANPQTDDELLAWYRTTDAYIWELTAYHSDPGFNYGGMVRGIVERLKGYDVQDVLCLGDGTGDVTLACEAGYGAVYHDLRWSQTASFAESRMDMRGSRAHVLESVDFAPPVTPNLYGAIVSLDFLEHVPNVEDWVRFVWESLREGGVFVAQNAFAIGSGPDGSIPMHLSCNDRWEKDWDPLLLAIGFVQLGPQWYRKPPFEEWPVRVEA